MPPSSAGAEPQMRRICPRCSSHAQVGEGWYIGEDGEVWAVRRMSIAASWVRPRNWEPVTSPDGGLRCVQMAIRGAREGYGYSTYICGTFVLILRYLTDKIGLLNR